MNGSLLIAAISVIPVALAQDSSPKRSDTFGPAMLVLPKEGTPLSAEVVEERIANTPDGKSKSEIRTGKVFRDVSGRMRIETEVGNPDGESMPMVQIIDAVDGFMAFLVPSQTIAAQFEFPKSEHPRIGVGSVRFGSLFQVPGKKKSATENLGRQTIDGIEYKGARTTTTAEEQPSLVAINEEWTSKELGLTGLLKSSGPKGRSNAKLQNVDRKAPDPALFKIPAGYLIHDMKEGDRDYQLR